MKENKRKLIENCRSRFSRNPNSSLRSSHATHRRSHVPRHRRPLFSYSSRTRLAYWGALSCWGDLSVVFCRYMYVACVVCGFFYFVNMLILGL